MNRTAWYCAIICCILLLPAGAAALVPDQVSLSSSDVWLVADGTDAATLTLEVLNQSNPMPALQVEFECLTPDKGSVSPTSASTDVFGQATTTFTASTVSGDAVIRARVYYFENGVQRAEDVTYTQQIDHDTPYRVSSLSYADEVSVGATVPITVGINDSHGNPVDDRRVAEEVSFLVGSPAGGAVFTETLTESAAALVDASGVASVTLQADAVPGENIIWVVPPADVPDFFITIYGIADGVPVSIDCTVVPTADPYPYVVADGESTFLITYTLYDEYGNPVRDRQVSVTTSLDESTTLTTGSTGRVSFRYGPRIATGLVDITATAVDNASVTHTMTVEFITGAPEIMVLTANPQTMASRDVWEEITAEVSAKVMDDKGNPVSGETVTFSITGWNVGVYNQTVEPELVNPSSALTDADGYATVLFRPGAFTTDDSTGTNYSANAGGTCTVQATWGGVSKTVEIAYRNYPYLSVETSVEPETVVVNGTVTVTVRLKGDGWALQPPPVDVVVAMDRGVSMLEGDTDHMVDAMDAAKVFTGELCEGWDHVGVLSFGISGTADYDSLGPSEKRLVGVDNSVTDDMAYINYHYPGCGTYYSDYATLDVPLTSGYSQVNTAIENLFPSGGTPLRYALYKSIKELATESTRQNVNKVVVLLMDSNYNWYGHPLASGNADSKDPESFQGGTQSYYPFPDLGADSQNMATYASENDVRIYPIYYGDNIPSAVSTVFQTLADSTGGKTYQATSRDALITVYKEIAGDLRQTAGVNTSMDLNFQNVEVNNVSVPGGEVFDYLPIDGVSTRILWSNKTATIQDETIDQSSDWTDHTLSFDIGTIKLGETWEVTFSLRVKKDGHINLFGPGTQLIFNDGEDTLTLPDTFITAVPDVNTTLFTSVIDVEITPDPPVASTDFLPVTWTLFYAGSESVVQEVYAAYSPDKIVWGSWENIATVPVVGGGDVNGTYDAKIDVSGISGWYKIRVYAKEDIAGGVEASDLAVSPVAVGFSGQHYIKIE